MTPNFVNRYFPVRISNAILVLQQSGNRKQSVEVQANGYAYSNGHFSYIPLNTPDLPTYNLYFNKALRLYPA